MQTYLVTDMTCGHCEAAVKRAVAATDPAAEVRVDLAAKRVSIDSALPPAAIEKALADAGYPAKPL